MAAAVRNSLLEKHFPDGLPDGMKLSIFRPYRDARFRVIRLEWRLMNNRYGSQRAISDRETERLHEEMQEIVLQEEVDILVRQYHESIAAGGKQ